MQHTTGWWCKSLRKRLPWLICGALIVSLAAGGIWWRHSKPVEQTMYFSPPFAFAARDMAIAPNGHTVAVVGARDSARKDVIWLYEVGSQEARSLADAEGATCPFWSADGEFVAFFADGKLKKIRITGGPAQTLCDAPSGRGGTWNKDGVIIFAPSGDLQSGLDRISDSGANRARISSPDASRGEDSHRWPMFLPDGKHYLYLAATFGGGGDADGIFMGLLDSNEKRFVLKTQHLFNLYVKNADSARDEQPIEHTDVDNYPNDWSWDGKYILYTHGKDLWIVTFPELKSRLFRKAPSTLKNGQFSPNGRWVAYTSNESGKWEIYVTDFPDARGKWQVSIGGGEQPRWARGGNEIFFLSPDNKLMAASVKAGAGFNASTPIELFQANPRETVATREQANYDVDQTGRFLINTSVKKVTTQPLTIVLNWNAGLK